MTLTQTGKQLQSISSAAPVNAVLGNLANISSALQNPIRIADNQRKKTTRYRLLDAARIILRNHNVMNSSGKYGHRTRYCLAVRHDKTRPIEILLNDNPGQSRASLQNLVTCTSICSCPVCAHKKMTDYGKDIKKALVWAEQNNLAPVMLTLTALHHRGFALVDFVKQFKSAWGYFSSGRQWRKFKATYHIKHHITAREVTRQRTDDNGWHYHYHVLLFLDKKSIMEEEAIDNLQEKFRDRWMTALKRNDLNGIPEIACDLRAGSDVGEQYLTKLGLTHNAKGQLDYELTGNANKGATIWDILDAAAFGDIEAEYLYLEYVYAMTGENWITFSHGLHDEIADIVLETEEISDDDKLTLWYWISQENWTSIVRGCRVGDLLHIAAKYRSREKIDEFIRMTKDDIEPWNDYYSQKYDRRNGQSDD